MKYIELPELSELSSELSRVNPFLDTRVTVGIEVFSTKPTSNDRRLQRTLDQQLDQQLDPVSAPVLAVGSYDATYNGTYLLSPPTSAQEHDSGFNFAKRRAYSTSQLDQSSPFGPMDQGGNRKQYAYLISVLNASDPDRDFSALQPEHFKREYDSSSRISHAINHTLLQNLSIPSVPSNLWPALDREIDLRDSKIFSLTLPQQFLQDDDSGTVWAKMWFFFNKRRKRVMFLYMKNQRTLYSESDEGEEDAVVGDLD